MNGITILNVEDCVFRGVGVVFVIVLVAIAVISICMAIAYFKDLTPKNALLLIIVGIISALGAFAITTSPSYEWNYTKYEAVIDDTVSWVELNEKYDIGETRGDITVLYDKNHYTPPNKR